MVWGSVGFRVRWSGFRVRLQRGGGVIGLDKVLRRYTWKLFIGFS